MAYHISIIRKNDQESPFQISLDELLASALVKEHATVLSEDKGGVVLRFDFPEDRSEFLYWQDGDIWSYSPEEEWFTFLIRLATSLDGLLQGDEGELYLHDGTVLLGDGAQRSARSLFVRNYVKPISQYISFVVVVCLTARLIKEFLV